MADKELPVGLRRLWRIASSTRLGRNPELDVDRVVRTAVELADRDGLEGASLPKVAKALGFTAMSLYRHVGSKDELLELMFDLAFADFGDVDPAPGQWRRGLRQWAGELRILYHRRPWLVRAPISGPPAGPHQIAFMDTGLRAMRDTGIGWSEKVGVMMLITGWVRHTAALDLDLAHGREGTGHNQAQAELHYGRSLARLVDPAQYPEMAALLASDVFGHNQPDTDDPAAQPDFVFGLERILDGVAALIA